MCLVCRVEMREAGRVFEVEKFTPIQVHYKFNYVKYFWTCMLIAKANRCKISRPSAQRSWGNKPRPISSFNRPLCGAISH